MINETDFFRVQEQGAAKFRVLAEFMATIRDLDLGAWHIRGHVLVGGQGAFPERALVCTEESEFRRLRGSVASLTCCDPEFFTNPSLLLDIPVQSRFVSEKPIFRADVVNDCRYNLQEVLPHLDSATLDTILFFRIPNLATQLNEGLFPEIARVLKPGGYFVGSGSFSGQPARFPDAFDVERFQRLELKTSHSDTGL